MLQELSPILTRILVWYGQYEILKKQSHAEYRDRYRKETWLFVFEVILVGTCVILMIVFISWKTGIQVDWEYWLPGDVSKWLMKRCK
jgi:hypothetical protein